MKESIFVAALRSFFKSIATILGISIGLGFVIIGVGILIGPNYVPPKSQPLLMPDANGNREMLPSNAPVILRLDFHGVIGVGDLTSEKIENILLDSQEDFLKGGRVKALLLHMDTPGGSAIDSDTIYRMLMMYKKQYNVPIYAYVNGFCASGGMYIASAADKIYSTPASVIGSVGVRLGPNFNFADAMSRYGVNALTLTEGKDKDTLNPFRPWKPDEDAPLKEIMASLYDQFTTVVSEARPALTKELLINKFGARVFIAQEAQKNGYIDVYDASYNEAVKDLAAAAQIEEKERYQVVQLLPPHPFLSDIAGSFAPVKVVKSLFGKGDLSELNGQFLYYYQP